MRVVEEGQIMLASRELIMLFSIPSSWRGAFGTPGKRSMAQSYRWRGGRHRAWPLFKTFCRSWYSLGTLERSGGWGLDCLDGRPYCIQFWRHNGLRDSMHCLDQLIWGLRVESQGYPITMGLTMGSLISRSIDFHLFFWKSSFKV